ncbi:MAG: Glu/Leu/Phe/Val dehydrogenase dimerization domain-containing protein [Alcanivorax sp.]|uniref:Glu/Leu/Phe/Val dehydrogenase family protein n=1 Tax=Alcanivorax sp. TaxID=1872427 RepID=UPI003C310DCF
MFVILEQTDAAELHQFRDPATGLRALIALHSTRLGPALGGCRCLPYPDEHTALNDVCRLARGMSYKAALAGLPLGGGKAVIMEPDKPYDRAALYRAFGDAVNRLGGRYITAMDAGTEISDLDQVATQTRHVWGFSGDGMDPSPYTALGVFAALDAGIRHRFQRHGAKGLHIAIQGLGHVGSQLALMLARAGARLTLADLDPHRAQRLADRLNTRWVPADSLYDVACDIFMPCALGGVLNADTIPRLHAALIVGAANNQLASDDDAQRLRQRDILYTPDYLNNAGGLISLALGHRQEDRSTIRQKVLGIGRTLSQLLDQADQHHLSPAQMADRQAEQRLHDDTGKHAWEAA